jgi:TRAP-type C4-dicarboxylate transport system permease small subunit
VRADLIVERLTPKARWYCDLFSYVVASLFALVLLLGSLSAVANFINRNTHSSDGMQIPLAVPATVMIIGCALFLLAAVVRTLQMLLTVRGKAR